MNLSELAESYLLALNHEANSLFIELIFLIDDAQKVKVFANNKDTSPISVEFIGLNIGANLSTYEGVPCLGEIESIEISPTGFNLEGDIGFVKVTADTWCIENAL